MADPGLIGFKNNPEGLGEWDWDWVSRRVEGSGEGESPSFRLVGATSCPVYQDKEYYCPNNNGYCL